MGANLRTALIAAVKRTKDVALRADCLLAGRSVLAWQAELAAALACERIICLCDTVSETILALQRDVEAQGREFHAVRSNLQLVGMVRADDELMMIADGLLADHAAVTGLVLDKTGDTERALKKQIFTIGAEHQLSETYPDDFERIDRERHWAGIAVIRAGQVERLADLPADSDAMSLLLRLALQAKIECYPLPEDAIQSEQGDARWLLAHDGAALLERENALIKTGVPQPFWTGPTDALASLSIRKATPRWIEKGPEISALAAGAFAAGGLVLASFGFGVAGLSIAAIGAFAGSLSGSWASLRAKLWSRATGARLNRWMRSAMEMAALVTVVFASGLSPNPIVQFAVPILAIGLSYLAGRSGNTAIKAFWQDRALHLVGFAVAAGAGYLGEVLAIFAIAALIQLLLRR